MQFRPPIMAVAVLVVGLVGVPAAMGTSEPPHYDGQTLFEGLFLGRGEVAERYPGLRIPSSDGVWTADQAKDLITAMKRADPQFFTEFEREITTGDRVRIERAALAADSLAARVMARGAARGAHAEAYGSYILVNRIVVKHANTIWDKNRVWGFGPRGGTLARDRWVNDVAEALAR